MKKFCLFFLHSPDRRAYKRTATSCSLDSTQTLFRNVCFLKKNIFIFPPLNKIITESNNQIIQRFDPKQKQKTNLPNGISQTRLAAANEPADAPKNFVSGDIGAYSRRQDATPT